LNYFSERNLPVERKVAAAQSAGRGRLTVTSFLAVSCFDGHQLLSDNFLAVSQVPISDYIFHGNLKMIIKQNVSSKYKSVWLKGILSFLDIAKSKINKIHVINIDITVMKLSHGNVGGWGQR
jgi:hypothetical protein